MAKKGGVQQLQADISTDEELEKFLERDGLLVLDIYSEWCGPCLGMVGSLRKIKLELGGDSLHLAICKADTLTAFSRFQRKSEPTWLFVVKGKAINLMFGTDVPALMKLITVELKKLGSKEVRTKYSIEEMQPEELQRKEKKEKAMLDAIEAELAAKDKARKDYLTYCTDMIMDNLLDIGVTIFGPQVTREMFKKVSEPADVMKLQCKDRKSVIVHKSDFETINFACPNPLSEDVIEQMDGKEIFMCYWKLPDDMRRPVPDVLTQYAKALTEEQIEVDELTQETTKQPPVLQPMDIKLEIELQDGEEYEESEEEEDEEKEKARRESKLATNAPEVVEEYEEDEEGEDEEGEEVEGDGEEGEGAETEAPVMEMDNTMRASMNLMFGADIDAVGEAADDEAEETPKVRTRKKIVKMPAVWVPNNLRTHAALIYMYFRSQTTPFLPPDPIPEPPYIIMAFDAYKKKDLIDVAERNRENVPLYGFFTSDDPEEAKFIANSTEKYSKQPQQYSDKVVFKVNKATSNTMLSLATYGPSYVSPNTVIGGEEAGRFFPETYKTWRAELQEEQEAAENAKKKKARKSTMGHETSPHGSHTDVHAEEPAHTSGEDSGESMPHVEEETQQTAEGAETAPTAPAVDGEAAPAVEGEAAPAIEGEAAPAVEGEAAPAVEGEASPAEVQAADAPPAEAPAETTEAPPAEEAPATEEPAAEPAAAEEPAPAE